jgi:PIN domain nuclease of toxin-antitoxin system
MAGDAAVNVLLDTCALLALARGDLPARAGAALKTADEGNVSSISPWEVALKVAGGKLRVAEPPRQWFEGLRKRYVLRELPLDAATACAAAELPAIHKDPFDRVLVALARTHGLVIVTSDENIAKYPGVKTVWS